MFLHYILPGHLSRISATSRSLLSPAGCGRPSGGGSTPVPASGSGFLSFGRERLCCSPGQSPCRHPSTAAVRPFSPQTRRPYPGKTTVLKQNDLFGEFDFLRILLNPKVFESNHRLTNENKSLFRNADEKMITRTPQNHVGMTAVFTLKTVFSSIFELGDIMVLIVRNCRAQRALFDPFQVSVSP